MTTRRQSLWSSNRERQSPTREMGRTTASPEADRHRSLDFTRPVVQSKRNLDSSHDLDDGFLRGPTSPLFLALLQPHDAPRFAAWGLPQQKRRQATKVRLPARLAHVGAWGDLLIEQEGDEIGDLDVVGLGRVAEARILDDAVDRHVATACAKLDLIGNLSGQ